MCDLHMVNKSVVAKSSEDLYPKSLEAITNKFVSPWVVVISLFRVRSGRLLNNSRSPVLIAESSHTGTMTVLRKFWAYVLCCMIGRQFVDVKSERAIVPQLRRAGSCEFPSRNSKGLKTLEIRNRLFAAV